ncbi:hypothetical protein GWK47_033924 [Chionoecetes opilio]|uniref:Uncharacterized protein n=1 Tax=Chionoecetes opilio TaxID=41210 RepID=A0A8J4YIS9_CHIOP|nr:hypothetical protein GWK47_033924 [Chionoecetes opilio]
MQEVVISAELQQQLSAVFGGYQKRRHNRPITPEVKSEVLIRRVSRRPSRQRPKCFTFRKNNDFEAFFLVKEPYFVTYNFKELTTFDDDDDKRVSDSLSSGFYDTSDRSSGCSIVSSNSTNTWESKVA